jgi:hypothetical protein
VITADPTRPLAATGGVIAELNGMPALHRHYQLADGDSVLPVAEPILARLLEEPPGAWPGARPADQVA